LLLFFELAASDQFVLLTGYGLDAGGAIFRGGHRNHGENYVWDGNKNQQSDP